MGQLQIEGGYWSLCNFFIISCCQGTVLICKNTFAQVELKVDNQLTLEQGGGPPLPLLNPGRYLYIVGVGGLSVFNRELSGNKHYVRRQQNQSRERQAHYNSNQKVKYIHSK